MAITNGKVVKYLSNPVARSTVAIEINGELHCTGSIFQQKVILTAAHCVDMIEPDDRVTVVFGLDSKSVVDRVSANAIAFPESYEDINSMLIEKSISIDNPRTDLSNFAIHDIALIFLKSDIPKYFRVAKKPNPKSTFTATESGIITGFGQTAGHLHDFGVLRLAWTKPVAVSPYVFKKFQSQKLPGTCRGDSGGPLYRWIDDVLVIEGVTSFGDYDCLRYGFHTRVAPYLSAINSTIEKYEKKSRGPK